MFRSPASPVVPFTQLTQAQLSACHTQTLSVVQQTVERWGVGQLVDMVYVVRRIMLRSVLAAFFEAVLPIETVRMLDGWLQAWSKTALSSPQRISTSPIQERRAAKSGARVKLRNSFTSLLAAAPYALVTQVLSSGDLLDGSIALVGLLCEFTALTTGWTLFLLSQHVGVADDLVTELRTTLGNAPPTVDQLHDVHLLLLLDGVVRESMRVLPAVGVGVQTLSEPWHGSPIELPAGATVAYSPYLLQRRPDVYYAPDRFRPQRWTQIEPAQEAWLPLGVEALPQFLLPLVLAQAKLIVAALMQRYQLVAAARIAINRARSLLLMPQTDIPLVITPIGRAAPPRPVAGDIRDVMYLP